MKFTTTTLSVAAMAMAVAANPSQSPKGPNGLNYCDPTSQGLYTFDTPTGGFGSGTTTERTTTPKLRTVLSDEKYTADLTYKEMTTSTSIDNVRKERYFNAELAGAAAQQYPFGTRYLTVCYPGEDTDGITVGAEAQQFDYKNRLFFSCTSDSDGITVGAVAQQGPTATLVESEAQKITRINQEYNSAMLGQRKQLDQDKEHAKLDTKATASSRATIAQVLGSLQNASAQNDMFITALLPASVNLGQGLTDTNPTARCIAFDDKSIACEQVDADGSLTCGNSHVTATTNPGQGVNAAAGVIAVVAAAGGAAVYKKKRENGLMTELAVEEEEVDLEEAQL